MPQSPGREDVSFLSLLLPLIEGWRAVVLAVLVVAGLTAAVSLMAPRRYEAVTALSTIGSGRGVPSDISSILGTSSGGGLQPTPALIVLLTQEPGVLYRTAMRPFGGPGSPRIIDRVAMVEGHPIPDRDVARSIGNMVESASDKETGVISLRVTSSDSALARGLAGAIVAEVSTTFINVAKAQATAMREAMTTRVDSAQRQLTRAEEDRQRFLAGNRTVNQFAQASLEAERLSRAVDLAQAVYSQAVKDRDAALGKELEDTPAVVVIDGPARTLQPVARQTAIKVVVVALFTIFAVWLVLLIRSRIAGADATALDERVRLRSALRGIPVLGGILIRVFGLRTLEPSHRTAAERNDSGLPRVESRR